MFREASHPLISTDELSVCLAAALNMLMIVMIFASSNPFSLDLKERKKLCWSYSYVSVVDVYCVRQET